MNILNDLYKKKLAENEDGFRFWKNYLESLKALNFGLFSDQLTVPVLVPVGSRIYFRGVLKHTNEITVSLGADYFAKCSAQQSEILRQHRIKDAEAKLEIFKKEKEYLESQINFTKENIFGNVGQEIIEVHTEEEDRVWREKHREHVRQYNQRKTKKQEFHNYKVSDDDLWNRLEELELQEELENEVLKIDDCDIIGGNEHNKEENQNNEIGLKNKVSDFVETKKENLSQLSSKQSEKLDLLQQILNKQNELEKKLTDLKNSDCSASKTENDLMSRLDELEQLDELEDEMDRLDDILHDDNEESDDDIKSSIKIKRSVCFVDEDESQTLEVTFKHSEIEPFIEPYNKEMGILKPSDIYAAFSHLFTETTSILRKTKYESNVGMPQIDKPNDKEKKELTVDSENIHDRNRTILIKDIEEKATVNENILDSRQKRPLSIFKKKRQNKS